MFAYVPEVPGLVVAVSKDDKSSLREWYHFNGDVQPGWSFDGSTFVSPPEVIIPPPLPTIEEIEQVTQENEVGLKYNIELAKQIAALETKQQRAVREALLGRPEALKELQRIDIDITLLRSKIL